MFYVNNDDMDDMFRQAAEEYPLKTEGIADWEKVSASLREEAGRLLADAGKYKKEKKRRIFFWWLLLLPLGWIGHDSWQKMSGNTAGKQKATTSQLSQEPENANGSGKFATNQLKQTASIKSSDELSNTKSTLLSQNKFNLKNRTEQSTKELNNKTNITTERIVKDISRLNAFNRTAHEKNHFIANGETRINNGKKDTNHKASGSNFKTTLIEDNTSRIEVEVPKNQTGTSQDISTKENDDAISSKVAPLPQTAANKNDAVLQPINTNDKKLARSTVHIKRNSHFYAGVMLGADISTVKFQSVKGVGNSVGILLGYHFGRTRLSVETGVYWDTKKYYSIGEYFNKTNIPYFNDPNIELDYVNGSCNMFEIPLDVRYNIKQTKNTSIFAVLGLSSYLMSKEAYGYGYKYYGSPGYGDHSYYHSTQNWFSIMNLSLGYEHRMGKIGDIRIEPYVKLPFAGIGKGSLPITSGGLNIGISRRF
ncbi:MAG TPA: hypothetical protein VNV85_13330 [Puia sp.]|jgi:hypothetical protein|nr:hypothetical protein [Puia sp.]